MKDYLVRPASGIGGEITPPADKSISHRAAIFSSLAEGESRISNYLFAEDCVNTLRVLKSLGVKIEEEDGSLIFEGLGLKGLQKPAKDLYFGNSATGMRLMAGVLAGQEFESILTGDESLSLRPMRRITRPLGMMGAQISTREEGTPPIKIKGGKLRAISYETPVASAQVKSTILLAGLYAEEETSVTEPALSRDHTEAMMEFLGLPIKREGLKVTLEKGSSWQGKDIEIPGDASSAAFFAAAAMLFKGSEVLIRGVNLNPQRTGFFSVAERMGAGVSYSNVTSKYGELFGDIRVKGRELGKVSLSPEEIPSLIDEIPLIALLATQAGGISEIKGLSELRKKETDRLSAITNELGKMGGDIKEGADYLRIYGYPGSLKGGSVKSYGDHRMAMMLFIAGLAASGETNIRDTNCIKASFPDFFELMEKIIER